MWQSPEDPNNPWQPFRAGPSSNIGNGGFSTQSHSCIVNGHHSNENWNSVKSRKNKDIVQEISATFGCEKYRNNETASVQRPASSRLQMVPQAIQAEQDQCWGKRKETSDHMLEYVFGNQNESVQNDHAAVEQFPTLGGAFQGNQWSPFLHGYRQVSSCHVGVFPSPVEEEVPAMSGRAQFEYRQPTTDDTCLSERSSYSTYSEEDVADGYELVEHQHGYYRDHNDNVVYRKNDQKFGDGYNTPPTSLSVNDTYHTAPNSPKSDHDFCIVRYPEDFDQSEHVGAVADTEANHHDSESVNRFEYRNQPGDGAEITSNECVEETTNIQNDEATACSLETFTENITACLEEAVNESHLSEQDKRDIINYRRLSERFDRSRIPKMELPPFIEVENIQYEADPKTGAVRTVGKGSFGQVFKARFADPVLQHLRIVVKEFNEEYTNRQEILEEAKRLLYLGDTGYVPICYGLVCLGEVHNPTYGLVQEYVGSGLTLEQVLWDQYDLEIYMWLSIAFQACEGLARFHEKGILLNDIKSNNIILEFFRNSVRIKYIDFGLATDMRGKRYKNTKSLEDYIYLAPEVRKEGCRTNIASDIFSLGYMLEQICSIAGVHELGFMTRLCMDLDPDSRLPVRAAANIIYEHMVTFNYDTSSLSR